LTTASNKASQIVKALFEYAKTMEGSGPSLPVNLPEEKDFTPPTDGKYLKVTFFPNLPRWEGIKQGIIDQGLLQISVVWPKSFGLIAPSVAAGQVCAFFAKGTTLTNGSTRVKITNEPWPAQPITEDNQVAIPVTVSWKA
jgi:hypothetical protein